MDEGLPIAYEVLEKGVPVYDSGGGQVGTVDHVVAAEREDIFHGLVVRLPVGQRFIAADDVASLHERGVDLRLGPDAIAALPEPHGAAPSYRDAEPGVKPNRWRHWLDKAELRDPLKRNWKNEN